MKKMKYIIPALIVGFLIAVLLGIGLIKVQAQNYANLGNPWDGAEKAWQQGTIVNAGFLYVFRDENIPPHFQFAFGERVYVQYEVDGYYFVEKYYDCFSKPIYGWIWHENVLLDINVIPTE